MSSNHKKTNKSPSKSEKTSKGPNSKKSMPSMGGSSGIQFANAVVVTKPTYVERVSEPFHPEFGKGVRLTGRQFVCTVATTASDSQLFSTTGSTAANNINSFNLSPDWLGGRIALEARTYQRYKFIKVRLIYAPRVAVTQAGEFAISYYSDVGAEAFFTPSFSAILNNAECMVSSFHAGGKTLVWELPIPQGGSNTYYTEADSASTAAARLSVQGQFQGWPDANSIGAVTMGSLSIEYCLDLYCPTSDLGFNFLKRIKSQDEAEFLQKCQEEFRSSKEKGYTVSIGSNSSTAFDKKTPSFSRI